MVFKREHVIVGTFIDFVSFHVRTQYNQVVIKYFLPLTRNSKITILGGK